MRGRAVYTPEEKPREVFVHPEDVKLDEEPTLFQQMLGTCMKLKISLKRLLLLSNYVSYKLIRAAAFQGIWL